MPLTDDFLPSELLGNEFLHDIDIFVCQDCNTVQTQHNVDMGDYYEDYQYGVGTSPTASDFMYTVAQNLISKFFHNDRALKVIEIGSGDGGQLLAFKDLGCNVLGYEPSSSLTRIASEKGIPTIKGLFDNNSLEKLPAEWQDVDIVMLSYTFDHLPNPREFINTAKQILNQEHGLLVIEVHNLQRIFERQEYCLFEHEHTIYLTEANAIFLCQLEGMTILDFDLLPEVDRRANSLIFVSAPAESIRAKTFDANQVTITTDFSASSYDNQTRLIERGIQYLDDFVERLTSSGMTIAGYGAGGRGVMTLASMKQAHKLLYVADKSPKGKDLFLPKSRLKLVGIHGLLDQPVDHILVFSFGYIQEIRAELSRFGYKPQQLHSLLDILSGKVLPYD